MGRGRRYCQKRETRLWGQRTKMSNRETKEDMAILKKLVV